MHTIHQSMESTQRVRPSDGSITLVKPQLKFDAKCDAYKQMWKMVYLHKMRYEPAEYQEELELDAEDILEFTKLEDKEIESELPLRYVVVGLPFEDYANYQEWYEEKAKKCSQKRYIGECYWTFEMGDEGTHPHINFVFLINPKKVVKSRIIKEFASTMQVKPNYVDVSSKGEHALPNLLKYITKEGSELYRNFPKSKPKNFLPPQVVDSIEDAIPSDLCETESTCSESEVQQDEEDGDGPWPDYD